MTMSYRYMQVYFTFISFCQNCTRNSDTVYAVIAAFVTEASEWSDMYISHEGNQEG